jgi:pyridoxal phosphate enzyme (YggS family)
MIRDNLRQICEDIKETARKCGRNPSDIKLVAVSKRFPVEMMQEARVAGQILFGENFIQEAVAKKEALGDAVRIHFIGHLQSNKAKTAAEACDVIETIDRFKIGSAINRHLEAAGRTAEVLVQVNVGLDPKKSGVLPDDTEKLLNQLLELPALKVKGLMTMPPFCEDSEQSRPFFRSLRLLSEKMKDKGLFSTGSTVELSMGMSNDYRVAIEEGATSIRIGTAIFGIRPPKA